MPRTLVFRSPLVSYGRVKFLVVYNVNKTKFQIAIRCRLQNNVMIVLATNLIKRWKLLLYK